MTTKLKILSLPLVAGLLNCNVSAQGWYIQRSFSPAQTLQTIKFYNSSIGYTVSSLYNGSTFNIYKTTDAGSTWIAQNSGYTSMRFMSIYIFHPDTVFVSGNNGIIVKTTNGGTTWVTIPTGVTDQLWSLDFTSRTTGYCAGSAGRVLKTTDGGNSWFSLNPGIQIQLNSLRFVNDSVGYVCGSPVLLRTTNRGDTWENLNFPAIPPFDQLRQIVFTDPVTAYVIADIGRVRKTTDGGISWTMLNTGTSAALFGIDFVDQSTAYACGDSGVIIRTTNAGQSWSRQSSGLNEILYGIDFTSRDTGYICSWSGKILKTTNGGATFVRQEGREGPSRLLLFQNYPNPFNPTTTIRFDLAEREPVTLRVFDMLGREVASLLGETLSPGRHMVLFDAKDLGSGGYFCRIVAGRFAQDIKVILVK
jgi:photosystem II stability/assembly factor-like uncharacterized protein